MREAVGVYYNYSGANVACYDLRAGVNEESRIVEYVPPFFVCVGNVQYASECRGQRMINVCYTSTLLWTGLWYTREHMD